MERLFRRLLPPAMCVMRQDETFPILESLARGGALGDVLAAICRVIERQTDGMVASILVVDADGRHLRLGAAPSLPGDFNQVIDGLEIGPGAGSCGAAAHRRELVVVEDIASDPLCRDYCGLAQAHGLLACWSQPVLAASGDLLGTFALYYRERRRPSERDVSLIERASRIAGIAIERHRAEAELRDREAQLRHGARMANLGHWVWDVSQDRCVVASEEYAAMFGMTPAEILADLGSARRMTRYLHSDDRQRYLGVVAAGRADGTPYDIEYRIVLPGQSIRYVRELAEYHADEAGHPVRAVGTLQDITPHRQAQERLHAAKEEAEAANRAKSDFLARVSHELRSPLNAIIGFAEILRDEAYGPHSDPKYRAFAANIFEASNHLLGVIGGLLDLAKIEAGKVELRETAVDVAALVRAAVGMVEIGAQAAEVALEVELPADLPRLRADERALRQMVLNLISNAIKFTPEGGRVTIGAGIESGGEFALRVTDTGIGIAAQDIDKALRSFGQVENASAGGPAGTGLGLPITESLVQSHGGRLVIASKLGAGTTVTLHFPAERVVPA